jgi:hypothetical protein
VNSMPERWKDQSAALRGALAILSVGASLAVAGCSSTIGFDDPFADYLQRTALVSTTGGDSQAANTVAQTATPWPRYANDTNIPANGARMTAVIKRYESGSTGASGSEGATQTSTSGGGANPGGGATNGASTGMGATPSSPSSGY